MEGKKKKKKWWSLFQLEMISYSKYNIKFIFGLVRQTKGCFFFSEGRYWRNGKEVEETFKQGVRSWFMFSQKKKIEGNSLLL